MGFFWGTRGDTNTQEVGKESNAAKCASGGERRGGFSRVDATEFTAGEASRAHGCASSSEQHSGFSHVAAA